MIFVHVVVGVVLCLFGFGHLKMLFMIPVVMTFDLSMCYKCGESNGTIKGKCRVQRVTMH